MHAHAHAPMCTGDCENGATQGDREQRNRDGDRQRDFWEGCICCPWRLPVKWNAKAAVWRYFGLEMESGMVEDPDLPVCWVCHVRIKAKHANTSNLYSHLKKHHLIEYQAVGPKRNNKGKGKASSSTTRECTIEESFKLATKLHCGSRKHKELTISHN